MGQWDQYRPLISGPISASRLNLGFPLVPLTCVWALPHTLSSPNLPIILMAPTSCSKLEPSYIWGFTSLKDFNQNLISLIHICYSGYHFFLDRFWYLVSFKESVSGHTYVHKRFFVVFHFTNSGISNYIPAFILIFTTYVLSFLLGQCG